MPDDRDVLSRAILAQIAADLEDRRAEQLIQKTYVAHGRVSFPTVAKVWKGGNCLVSTLVDIADALDCDVKVTIEKRSA